MFWEEKIDLVKKQFSQSEFKDPFLSGPEIIEKIIRRFHNSTRLVFLQSEDRVHLMKDCSLIKQCGTYELYQKELEKLDSTTNYWLYLIPPSRVYDCRKDSLRYLLYLASGQKNPEFYIIDKKYLWAVYVKIDSAGDSVEIYKSGIARTFLE